jgi:hypothetical protein
LAENATNNILVVWTASSCSIYLLNLRFIGLSSYSYPSYDPDTLICHMANVYHNSRNFVYVTAGGSKASKASDVAVSCLEKMVIEYQSHHVEHAKDIAAVVFRLLIIHPKVS